MKELLNYDHDNHEYFILTDRVVHIPSVSEILKPILSDYDIPPFYAERGTLVHEATESFDEGTYLPELVDPMVIPYLIGYENFLDEHEVVLDKSELMVFDEELLYAGRLDRIWTVDGRRTITDIKTGGKYRWHPVQLVAYLMASDLQDCAPISSLYLNEFAYKFHYWDSAPDWETFKALVEIYWFNHPADYKRLKKL